MYMCISSCEYETLRRGEQLTCVDQKGVSQGAAVLVLAGKLLIDVQRGGLRHEVRSLIIYQVS